MKNNDVLAEEVSQFLTSWIFWVLHQSYIFIWTLKTMF